MRPFSFVSNGQRGSIVNPLENRYLAIFKQNGAGIPVPPGSKEASPLLNCVNYNIRPARWLTLDKREDAAYGYGSLENHSKASSACSITLRLNPSQGCSCGPGHFISANILLRKAKKAEKGIDKRP